MKRYTWTATEEMRQTIMDFMDRITREDVERILARSHDGIHFSDVERDLKADMLFLFFENQILSH